MKTLFFILLTLVALFVGVPSDKEHTNNMEQ